ncbi:EAL domain-containing response regulator [Planktothrix paucivesiculata]|uniref:Cyclic diguanylate phosphodiesterase (EAL) domain protein n=1 Tax=Planktothrix paucivesiculata PCC 9631 TaxID=671071 RepID=A0A7Z9BM46_9CYAN|nr:EAL domain-containing response regulator [Planktothrix paucivesiculata]VXD17301.1 Cyclic diguanylate phosphodiesterase (EAL) domain protein [Planktothrix paucivesiculata PCC 9631]
MSKILVIEDEDLIRDNIIELLETEKFEVFNAGNGKIGLQLAIQHQPDLILCDVAMPEIDGYGVLVALQKNPVTATIPFIFLTANSDVGDLRKGMQLGADDYLTKPFTPTELLKAIVIRLKKNATLKANYTHQLKIAESKLNQLIYQDSPTNLPNRLSLLEYFQQRLDEFSLLSVANQNWQQNGMIPIIYLGIDRFGRINDILGYEGGDSLLKAVAERLRKSLPADNIIIHIDSNQFAILLPPILEQQQIKTVIENLQQQISDPFVLTNREVLITVSAGISLYPQDGRDIQHLLREAKQAMNQVKQQGGNHYSFYIPASEHQLSERIDLEVALRYALEREELELYYQPQVSLKTGNIIGAEALLRWKHPQKGRISPIKFIPIAEETGLIESIGEWVLSQACQHSQAWRSQGLGRLRVAVNLSGRQFQTPNLCQKLMEILLTTGCEPDYLELELTESLLIRDAELSIQQLQALKALGVTIAIDDFGTGYSSLSYLQKFPFDVLKIDQSFVRNLHTNKINATITQSLISMAHLLNLKVIAEGVETQEELNILQSFQCDEIQGYLFSRPLNLEDFQTLVKSGSQLNISQPHPS